MADLCVNEFHREEGRLRAVAQTDLAKLRADRDLDRIVGDMARRYRMPIAAITLLTRHQQLMIARVGLLEEESARDQSFCTEVIRQPGEVLVVPDARLDPKFAEKALVVGAPFLRFYAGIAVVNRDGYPLGSLCLADTQPHTSFDAVPLMMMAHEVERRVG